MELARAWFRGGQLAVPKEFEALLADSPRLESLTLETGIPELVTTLPERGEGRNHDLWLLGNTPSEQITICVEAKADEPFGDKTVGEYWNYAMRRLEVGEKTKVPNRIEALLQMVNEESTQPDETPWSEVQYQLLTSICGTALQAIVDRSSLAVLIVHVFRTDSTIQEKIARNQSAFNRFVRILTGSHEDDVRNGYLYGPIPVGGVECLVGKVETRI